MHKTAEYSIWAGINQRCYNPKIPGWHNYGGRGIQVCEDWRKSFESFYAYVGPRPSRAHSLDRFPNNDGNYEPGNVRWATTTQQGWNKRGVVWKRIVLLIAAEHGISPEDLWKMVLRGDTDAEIAAALASRSRIAA